MAGGERGVQRAADILAREVDPDDAAARRRLGGRADAGARCGSAPEVIAAGTWGFLGCGMDVVEVVPSFEQYAFTFGGVAPLRRVAPGTALRLWSDDAFCGALRSVKDLSSEKVDLRYVNPQTGPFYVEGAEPGDTLALHFVAHGAGPRLGRLGDDPVLRRPDQHRPGRDAAGPAAGHHLDLRAGPGAEHRHLRRAAQRPADRPARRADARHRRRRPAGRGGAQLPGARALRRQHGHPADAGRHHLLPRRQRRGRAVLRRGRPLPAGRGRGLRHRRRGRDDDDADRRADQGRRARSGRGWRTTPTG